MSAERANEGKRQRHTRDNGRSRSFLEKEEHHQDNERNGEDEGELNVGYGGREGSLCAISQDCHMDRRWERAGQLSGRISLFI